MQGEKIDEVWYDGAEVKEMEFLLNGKRYEVLRFLGKGKGGYSYLVTDGVGQYTLKKIHHEPCDYYTFGDKLGSELRDYERLRAVGIPMPELLAVDREQELILKDFIDGDSIYEKVLRVKWFRISMTRCGLCARCCIPPG